MWERLNRTIDSAILIYFRLFTGLLLAQELVNALIIGRLQEYSSTSFHFTYLFTPWIGPWGPSGMKLHFALTIIAGVMVAFGFFYRLSAIILFLGYLSLFLMEMSEYINHKYLYCMISFWLIWLPLGRQQLKSQLPAWMLYLVLFHMGIAYFFAGVAKINPDWMSGSPMDLYLEVRSHFLLGKFYTYPMAPLIFSWGGLVFDLLIVPALLWKPTRMMALASALFFHVSNSLMFGLATFPWFSLLMSTLFFDPSWPRKIPGFSIFLPKTEVTAVTPLHRGLAVALGLYVILHLALPFRHHFYPGDASWTEEGHMFAWRMMLRNKTGNFKMWVKDKTNGTVKKIDPNHYLTKRQFQSMVGDPDLILQFAHYIKKQHHNSGQEVEVYASSLVSLNGKEKRELLRQGIDLSTIKRSLEHYAWIQK